VLVADGEVLDPERSVRIVTLNFLVNPGSTGSDFGGDNYPFPYFLRLNGVAAYDRRDLNSATLSPSLPSTFPAKASFAAAGTEQDAFAEYLKAFHTSTPFAVADTTSDLDRRIVQGSEDSDGDGLSNADEVSLLTLGLDPDRAASRSQANALLRLRRLGQAEVVGSPATFNLFTPAQIAENRLAGRREVIGDPTAYGLFSAPRADLRLDGLILPISTNAPVNFRLQSSDDLKRWVDTVVVTNVPVDLTVPTRFFRFRAE
jgi:hypothetical protein